MLTPNGINGPYEQIIGSELKYDVGIQATFSPDGSKFCITNYKGWFDYFNLDRCTGEFFDYQSGNSFNNDSAGYYGCSFSPNSRFLYISTKTDLYQYDTYDSNMLSNAIHIATWDSFVNPYFNIPVLFFMHQLAADGKIYIAPLNGVEYLNVINMPDSAGLSCNFTPHSFQLIDSTYTFNIPSFPNYDLGALEGSPCDTIVGIPTGFHPPEQNSFRLYPNPASDWINIVYHNDDLCLMELFDTNGKRVAAASLFHYFKNRLINVSELPAGVYLAVVSCKGEKIWSEKVMVQH